MDIMIDKIKPADAEALLAYLRDVGGETDNLTFGAEGLPFSVEDEAAMLARMEGSNDAIMFTAKQDGRIVGLASLNRLPRRMRHRGDFAVSVRKDCWNRGIGSRLLTEVIRFAKEHDFEIIDLQVRCDNVAAIHLYEKYGFQKLCTYPGFFKMESGQVDFDYMIMRL